MYDPEEIGRIKAILSGPKPGLAAQKNMAPAKVDADKYYQISSNAHKAAVMLLLYKEEKEWHTVFMKRTNNHRDKHSGQISFPGGRLDKDDISIQACAIRETKEEIGIGENQLSIIGNLSPLYVYASNHLVYPFVGLIKEEVNFDINTDEVAEIFTAPINHFYHKNAILKTDMNLRGYKIQDVPYYNLFGEVLWGATAMMLAEFLDLWQQPS